MANVGDLWDSKRNLRTCGYPQTRETPQADGPPGRVKRLVAQPQWNVDCIRRQRSEQRRGDLVTGCSLETLM